MLTMAASALSPANITNADSQDNRPMHVGLQVSMRSSYDLCHPG